MWIVSGHLLLDPSEPTKGLIRGPLESLDCAFSTTDNKNEHSGKMVVFGISGRTDKGVVMPAHQVKLQEHSLPPPPEYKLNFCFGCSDSVL